MSAFPIWNAHFAPALDRSDYNRLAAPQLLLPFVAFHIPAAVVALVQAGGAGVPSVGTTDALP